MTASVRLTLTGLDILQYLSGGKAELGDVVHLGDVVFAHELLPFLLRDLAEFVRLLRLRGRGRVIIGRFGHVHIGEMSVW